VATVLVADFKEYNKVLGVLAGTFLMDPLVPVEVKNSLTSLGVVASPLARTRATTPEV